MAAATSVAVRSGSDPNDRPSTPDGPASGNTSASGAKSTLMPTANSSAPAALVTDSAAAAAAAVSGINDNSCAPGKSVNPLTSLVTRPYSWSVAISNGAPDWVGGTCDCNPAVTAATCSGVPPAVPSTAPCDPIRITPPRCSRPTRSVPTASAELAMTTVPARSGTLIAATAAAAAAMSAPVTGPPGGTGAGDAAGTAGAAGGAAVVVAGAGTAVTGELVVEGAAALLLLDAARERADEVAAEVPAAVLVGGA